MAREDEKVDAMEIDVQHQQVATTAVPDGFNADYLRIYYGKLFPHGDFFKWLSYGNDGKHPGRDQSYVGRREFSFTLENDIYLRFQSFDSVAEMESSIKEKCPFKIDIGPVYSVDPAKRHAYAQSGNNAFVPVERELIFDIDISDYEDVRYCCSGADVCMDCWPLMTIAIKSWMLHLEGAENTMKRVSLTGAVLHPFLARSYTDVLMKGFFKISYYLVNNSLHLRRDIRKYLILSQMKMLLVNSMTSGKETYNLFYFKGRCKFCQMGATIINLADRKAQGCVCVPIDPDNCDDFDPMTVPTLSQLLGELNAAGLRTDSEND